MKVYKIKPKRLRETLGINIRKLAVLLGCRRESIYYALQNGREKSKLRKKIDALVKQKLAEKKENENEL